MTAVLELVKVLAESIAGMLSAETEEQRVEHMMRASRALHDEIARRKFGG